ncbi:MAG: Lar family restriction alleviation protein [Synergistaceae bacterium]|nr:Lar family restriction alleviation protein [Synergistaceae bacterium]
MKSIFVVLPLGIENALEVASSIALAASMKLGEYLQILPDFSSSTCGFGRFFEKSPFESKANDNVDFLSRAISYMAYADYIAFTPDWRMHKDCQILRVVAEAYGLNILEAEGEEQDVELKPCPFCGSEELSVVHAPNGCLVRCRQCAVSTTLCSTEQEASDLWNNRKEG